MKLLDQYIAKLTKLNRGVTQYGKAPHKPVFLLAILDEIEQGRITENKVYITPELVATFKDNFALLVDTPHKADFIQPFHYLQGDKFWFVQGKDNQLVSTFIRSFNILNEKVDFGFFDDDLFMLLAQANTRDIIKVVLLDTFFPTTKAQYLQNKGKGGYSQDIEQSILQDSPTPYSLPTTDEEEQFVRGGLFKKLIPQVYGFTCAISGMKVISNHGFLFIDACHIVPFSVSKNDTVGNGIALCPNLHRAFDRGLIGVDTDYKVLVSNAFAENENNPYSLKALAGKPITLPFGEIHYPKKENFEWHLANVFKA
ncbi:MAG: restriction endonuclease [Cytophagales bacterium]|nr:MAG: restriction endonuclease [Cytophagales bacterium]